jgi:hypothetical protein
MFPLCTASEGYTINPDKIHKTISISAIPTIKDCLKFFLNELQKSEKTYECVSCEKFFRTFTIPAVAGPIVIIGIQKRIYNRFKRANFQNFLK